MRHFVFVLSMNPPSIVSGVTADWYDAHVLKNYARAALTLVRGKIGRAHV